MASVCEIACTDLVGGVTAVVVLVLSHDGMSTGPCVLQEANLIQSG